LSPGLVFCPHTTPNPLSGTFDLLLWYARDESRVKYHQLYAEKTLGAAGGEYYRMARMADGTTRPLSDDETADPRLLRDGRRIFRLDNLISQSPGTRYDVELNGKRFFPTGYWKTDQRQMPRLLKSERVEARANSLAYVRYLDDFPVFAMTNAWTDTAIAGRPGDKVYLQPRG